MRTQQWLLLSWLLTWSCHAESNTASLHQVEEKVDEKMVYRILLKQDSRSEPTQSLGYHVRIEGPLDKSRYEKLICQFIETEKPQGYARLSLSFYTKIDEYIPPIHHPGLTEEYSQQQIASYVWNRKIPANPYALAIFKDESGNRLPEGPRFHGFDHFRDCK